MYCAFWILENITFSDFGLSYLIVSCVGREMIPPTPCNLPAFMVQYSGIQKDVSDSACCVVRIRMRVLYDGFAVNQVRWGTKQP